MSLNGCCLPKCGSQSWEPLAPWQKTPGKIIYIPEFYLYFLSLRCSLILLDLVIDSQHYTASNKVRKIRYVK
jgi:hypothetical protein